MTYEPPRLTYLGNIADPPVCIVDVEVPISGYRLRVERRATQHCDATLYDHAGHAVYMNVLWPSAEAAIESAIHYLREALRLPHVATALRESALAELR